MQVHGDGLATLRSIYDDATEQTTKPTEIVYESRRTVLLANMASELHMLTAQLYRLAQQHRASRDFTQPALRQALREVLASMTVYRTYARGDSWDITEADYRTVTSAVRMAKRRNRTTSYSVFDFIASVLLLEHPPTITPEQAEQRRQFTLKFQQVSGPVAAKGVEDTAFYRYYPLASLNEVGGELDARPLALDEFHRLMHHRMHEWPHSMCATATHDAKRGEDFRARLHVLSEAPVEWARAFSRWQKMNRSFLSEVDGDAVPNANEEYLIYETLVGTWPLIGNAEADFDFYRDRILQYFEKAFREAKVQTSWMNADESYETAVRNFIMQLLAPENQQFADDVTAFVALIADAGFVNSLAQLLLKTTLPGMPDFYRGTEFWDFNLVDPDNRRPVDYDSRRRSLKSLWAAADKDLPAFAQELAARWPDPEIKLWLTSSSLRLRRDWPDLFTFGEYIPLTGIGAAVDHVLAFARRLESQIVISVVPRHFYRLIDRHSVDSPESGPPQANWSGTALALHDDFPDNWTDCLSGCSHTASAIQSDFDGNHGRILHLDELLAVFPVALIISTAN